MFMLTIFPQQSRHDVTLINAIYDATEHDDEDDDGSTGDEPDRNVAANVAGVCACVA